MHLSDFFLPLQLCWSPKLAWKRQWQPLNKSFQHHHTRQKEHEAQVVSQSSHPPTSKETDEVFQWNGTDRGLIKYEKGFDISNTLKYSKHSFFFDKRRGTWRWLSSQLVKKQWSSGADDKQLGTLILTGFTAHCNREQSYLCPTRRQSPW